jgi:hypothetical protein
MLGQKAKPWDALLCASCRVQKATSSEWSERSGTCRFEFLPRNSGCRYGLPTICARVAREIKSGVKCGHEVPKERTEVRARPWSGIEFSKHDSRGTV